MADILLNVILCYRPACNQAKRTVTIKAAIVIIPAIRNSILFFIAHRLGHFIFLGCHLRIRDSQVE